PFSTRKAASVFAIRRSITTRSCRGSMTDQSETPENIMDYTQTFAMVAKPVIASVFTLLALFGVHWASDNATLNAVVQVVATLGDAGVLIWAWWHSKQITADTHAAAAAAYIAGTQTGVKLQTDPNHPAVQSAARSAVAS